MAQEPSGTQAKTPWTKIFTAFKVALDVKKLALAAVGILLVWVGWLTLSATFYGLRTLPKWKDYEEKETKDSQWTYFKAKRASWNLLHELAGSPSDHQPVDAADVADNLSEFLVLDRWEQGYRKANDIVIVTKNEKGGTLEIPALGNNKDFTWNGDKKDLPSTTTLAALTIKDNKEISINGVVLTIDGGSGKFDDLKDRRDKVLTEKQIADDGAAQPQALAKFNAELLHPKYKPTGRLRVSPWSEYRGGNQYLIVADTLKSANTVGTGKSLVHWLLSSKALVVVEPLVKFLLPLVYLFDSRAGGWDRLYLITIILWTLAVWGFFGGAISRIAAVQIARNERISLGEAIAFTRERFVSYFAAPVFPMVLLTFLVVLLMIFGLIEWIPYLGDLFAGLLWPVVIVFGFMMAIVAVGLIGWPLMVSTISTEGTDSFDALSRSYSYVYQAPWQYLWYNFLALVYGAVLIFFIGFMASLMVFMGKWGVSSMPAMAKADPKYDREPSYLFYYAPTSYGWRDLLISSNVQHIETRKEIAPDGNEIDRLEFKPDYEKEITGANTMGAFLVAVWIYPLFLLVLGFGYSYFWSSSTIIYFLMRRHVDDTEMDEVHQEDEDLEDPFLKTTTPPAPAPPPPAPPKPGTVSLNVVDAPPPAPAATPSYTAPPANEPAPPAPPPPENPPA